MNYYDRIAHLYDATRPLPSSVSEAIAECILQLVAATPETTFLEPGIGTGRMGLPIIRRGYTYTGVDISQEMMAQLRYKLGGTPVNLTLVQADASVLPFADNSFDVVLTTHLLHCLPDWRAGVAEIYQVLNPQGSYLSCETLMPPHQREFESHLKAILVQHQLQQTTRSCSSPQPSLTQEEIANVSRAQGATVETVTAASWKVEQTVGELVNIYQSRAVGLCWSVSQDILTTAMAEFKDWCWQHYESFEAVLTSEVTADILIARGKAVMS